MSGISDFNVATQDDSCQSQGGFLLFKRSIDDARATCRNLKNRIGNFLTLNLQLSICCKCHKMD